MIRSRYNYSTHAGIHEFTSPTYTYVQLTALYPGYCGLHYIMPTFPEFFY